MELHMHPTRFLINWIIATGFGWLIGSLLYVFAALAIYLLIVVASIITLGVAVLFAPLLAGGLFGALIGACLGVCQAFVLRRWILSADWIRACVWGSVIAGGIMGSVIEIFILLSGLISVSARFNIRADSGLMSLVMFASTALAGAIQGALMGLMQRRVLHKRFLVAKRWMLFSILGWLAGWIIGGFVGAIGFGNNFWPLVVGWNVVGNTDLGHYLLYAGFAGAVTGLIGGALTGIELMRILQRQATPPE